MTTNSQRTNISVKLKKASVILADESFCDDEDDYVLRLVKAGLVTKDKVYYALRHYGFTWNIQKQRWELIMPEWIANCHRPNHKNYKIRRSIDV